MKKKRKGAHTQKLSLPIRRTTVAVFKLEDYEKRLLQLQLDGLDVVGHDGDHVDDGDEGEPD